MVLIKTPRNRYYESCAEPYTALLQNFRKRGPEFIPGLINSSAFSFSVPLSGGTL